MNLWDARGRYDGLPQQEPGRRAGTWSSRLEGVATVLAVATPRGLSSRPNNERVDGHWARTSVDNGDGVTREGKPGHFKDLLLGLAGPGC